MGNSQELMTRFEEAAQAGDFGRMAALTQEYATEDFIQEWPQSGERLTKANAIRLAEHYPEMAGKTPKFTYKRTLGGGDLAVIEGSIDYGDGIPVSYVGVAELRDGKITKMTEYFANPFEAPAWRADFVEKGSPVRA